MMATASKATHEIAHSGKHLHRLMRTAAHRLSSNFQAIQDRELAALRTWLPERVASYFTNRYLVCRLSEDQLALLVAEGSRVEPLSTVSLAGDSGTPEDPLLREQISQHLAHCDRQLLELDSGTLVQVHTILPLATEENLQQVLDFEMNRLTPFRADQVYYDYRIQQRDSGTGKLHLDLYLIPKARLDRVLEYCTYLHVEPDEIRHLQDTGASLPVRLLPRARSTSDQLRRWINPMLFVTAVLLIMALPVLPLLVQRHTLSELERELETLRQQAVQVAEVRREVQQRIEVPQSLVQSQLQRRTMIEVLSELTDTIPEHTWLQSVRFDAGRVTIGGKSERATALPALVEENPLFGNVRFDAPVTSHPRSEREVFTISAEIAARRANDG